MTTTSFALIAGNGAQHTEAGALPQMQIEQHHVHRLTLQCGDRIGFAVDGAGQLHPGHAQQRFAQPLGQHTRILDQQYRQITWAHCLEPVCRPADCASISANVSYT